MTKRIAILASGTGTNAVAIMNYAREQADFATVVGVISNKIEAPVLQKAREFDVPAMHIPHRNQKDQLAQLKEWQAEWICLAGYMRIVTDDFLAAFYDESLGYARVINIHPSLLPAYPGLNAYEQAFIAGDVESGVTVHLVDEKLDHGPILLQEKFSRDPGDDLESFTQKGRALENALYVRALDGILKQEIQPVQQEENS